jgi:hypothetical protein
MSRDFEISLPSAKAHDPSILPVQDIIDMWTDQFKVELPTISEPRTGTTTMQ